MSSDILRGRPGPVAGFGGRAVPVVGAVRIGHLEAAGTPGVLMPSDDDLFQRTLAFSDTYVSDDGTVTIRRSGILAVGYSGDRFVGYCTRCSGALLLPTTGEPLTDVRAAVRFLSTHDHGDVD